MASRHAKKKKGQATTLIAQIDEEKEPIAEKDQESKALDGELGFLILGQRERAKLQEDLLHHYRTTGSNGKGKKDGCALERMPEKDVIVEEIPQASEPPLSLENREKRALAPEVRFDYRRR